MAHTQPTTDTLRPWQFFMLLALFCATGAVFVVRGTSPENVILICLAIGSAALVGLGALRTFRPLVSPDTYEAEMVGNRTRAALEREKNLILRSIKELEFDHAMGKVSAADYEDMVGRLRARAVRLLKQLDTTGSGYRELIERELASRLVKVGAAPFAEGEGFSSEQRAESKEQRAESREQRAESKEQRAESKEQRAESNEQRAEPAGACGVCGTSNDSDARFCKSCGAKLIAILLAVLTFAIPAFAQLQMPDPKEMAGIPRPVTDLPEGHVSVRLIRGQLSNNIAGHPIDLLAGSKVITTVKTDDQGRAEFSGVAAGTGVKAVAIVDGERLETQEFPWPGQGGIRVMLVATLKGGAPAATLPAQPGNVVLGDQTRVIIDLGDEALQVYYLLDIQNTARAPVNPASAFILDMPSGAQGTGIIEGAPQAVARGSRVTVMGPFAPGQTGVQASYVFPYTSGETSITQKLPVPSGGVAVLMKKVGDMSLTSPELPIQEEREFDGEAYVLAQGPPLAAGASLTLNISGLPHHSPTPFRISLALAGFMFVVGVWAAVRVPQQGGNLARVKHLSSKREKIFADLVRLEQQRRAGTVDAARYGERRQAFIAQLERVYRDLDAESGQGLAA